VWLLAPPVSEQVGQIADKLPQAADELRTWAEQSSLGRSAIASLPSMQELATSDAIGWGRISGAFSSVAGVVTNIFFIGFVGLYLAVDPAVYKRGMLKLAPLSYRTRAGEVLDTISHQLGWWLVGRFLSMLAVAVLTTIALWILGVPLALVLGLLSGLLSFVPIIGPIASFFPAALMALLVGPSYVLYTALLYMGVQALESNFITPIIQQRTVSLPPALILIAQLIAGILFGFIGIIVATPVAVLVIAIINLVYIEDVLGDRTSYGDKIPGSDSGRARSESVRGRGGPGAEPEPST
jgi:predicted PurR-regulated permease PerM